MDSKTICAKPLSPLPYCSTEDVYGLDALFSQKMRDPEKESGEPVNTYYTLGHTFVVPKKFGILQEIYKIQGCRPPQERNYQILHKVPTGMGRGAGAQGYHSCGSAIWQAILWVSQASCG